MTRKLDAYPGPRCMGVCCRISHRVLPLCSPRRMLRLTLILSALLGTLHADASLTRVWDAEEVEQRRRSVLARAYGDEDY